VEASAIQAPAVVARPRPSLGASLLRLRSDEQLVALFRAGHDEAFRVIHDRYRQRLFAYTRQMLPHRQDAEDALQDVFVRAYASLRASDRELALRAWLYRVAHNRCVDELRRPAPPPPEALQLICSPIQDPIAQADQRESLRRLVADVRRLPPQQRSALLMRELGGMPYSDLAAALGVSVPAVKSLLVRARLALAQAVEARETACSDIREELIVAHDRRIRPNANARRHLRDCAGCRHFRGEMRGMSRQLAALVPAIGPLGMAAKVLGIGGSAGGGAAAGGGGAAVIGGAAGGGGALVSAGARATGAGHVAKLIAATVVTAGGAVEIQHTITQPAPAHHGRVHHVNAAPAPAAGPVVAATSGAGSPPVVASPAPPPTLVDSPAPASALTAASSAGAPLKAIAGKAVTKVSSVVSTTTKEATKRVKSPSAPGQASEVAGSPITTPGVAASSQSSTTTAATAGGSTTATAGSGQSTGAAGTTSAGAASASPEGTATAAPAATSGSGTTDSAAAGDSGSGSGTTKTS
jgi:RNA polymerase sigma factor (sigma-70 family)